MSYLTYQQYKSHGGTAELSAFPLLERRARAKLDCWTQGRITEVDCDIHHCMTLMINALDDVKKHSQGGTVSSFSDDSAILGPSQKVLIKEALI